MARDNTGYMRSQDAPRAETATRARQGSRGRPVLVILIVSVLLALVVWGVVEYSVFKPDENLPPNPQTETAPVPQQPSGSGTFDNDPANGRPAAPSSTETNPTPQDSTGAPRSP
ncbi:hypothetical protein ACUTJJ_06630 [Agrobacterium sp. DKPNP3]|uniref:hypothetical protein n=1 Tax=Agrobacterium sp. DKPNP3 TaxID=3457323 RepID=UPI004044ADA2